jgi:multidrug transporter EmrE-like cation transporter
LGNRFEIQRRLHQAGPEYFHNSYHGYQLVSFGSGFATLPVGTRYAVWTGIGTVGAAILGILLFNESREIARILCILLIVAGIIGLKLTSPE